jgi:beta-mannanase
MYLKAIQLPKYRPIDPDPNDKSQLPDDSTWLYDEYDTMRNKITDIIEPLDKYIETYAKFEAEYNFNPDAEIAQFEDPENWPDVETLKS